MLRTTISLAVLALITLAVSRMSCFAQNEELSFASTTPVEFEVAEPMDSPAPTEFPQLAPPTAANAVEEVLPEFATASTNSFEDPVYTPVVATPMSRDTPSTFPNFEPEPVFEAPETEIFAESVEDIAWQDFGQLPSIQPPSFTPPPSTTEADTDPFALPDTADEESAPDFDEAAEEEATTEDAWKPALNVILNQPAAASPTQAMALRQVTVQIYKPVKERGSVKMRPVHETRQILTISGGVTLIRCDDIDVSISHDGENAGNYEFEINGQLELRNASVTIEAESAALKDGELTLKTVTLKSPHTTLKSDEVKLDLTVTSLRIGEPIDLSSPEATPSTLEPIPARSTYQPAANSSLDLDPFFDPSHGKSRLKGGVISH